MTHALSEAVAELVQVADDVGVELLLPAPEKFSKNTRISLFYDIGNVFYIGNTTFFAPELGDDGMLVPIEYDFDFSELRQSVGVAVQWLAPLGVFRFSYAVPLNDEGPSALQFEDETEQFQFSIGSAF